MSATHDSTSANPEQLIADLQRQLAERTAERDEALGERDKAQRKLAERNAERDEVLEQQTATAEVLQVINSSPGDLAPVFDAMLEKAVRLCDSAFGMMSTWDGERINRVAWHGISAEQIDAMRQSLAPTPGTPGDRIARGEDVVCIADLVEETAAPPTLMQLGGRSYALVALRQDGRLLGALTIFRREVRPFTDKEIALLQNFAGQAVIAMENARLLTETREALDQQTATAEVLQVINSSPGDLAPVFEAMLEKAIHLCEAAFGDLGIFDGEQYRWVAAHGIPDFAEYSFPLRPDGNSPMEQLTRGERLVHLADVRQSDAYREFPAFKSTMDRRAVRSLLVVPLRTDGALLGAIRAYRTEVRPFSDKQIALMQNFAAQAGHRDGECAAARRIAAAH
jgi:GAF domain-containing protein